MNLQQLIYFEKVAELEHYTRAAEELHITQPCMSHAISELEKELGVSLFYKKGRNIKLTRYGMLFHEHVEKSLKELNEGVEEIRSLSSPQQARIFLGHISSMYLNFIPKLMTTFYRDPRNLGIRLDMEEMPTRQLVMELKARKLDVGFGGYVEDPELQFDRIYTERLVVIVGENHPLAEKESILLKETEGYSMIAYKDICSIRACTDQMFAAAGVRTDIVGEYKDNNMIVGLVSQGDSFALVPELFGIDRAGVRKLTILDPGAERDLYMISIKDDYHTPGVDHFMDFIREMVAGEEDTDKTH